MAPSPNRRELVLDHGRVFIEVPQLMTDECIIGTQIRGCSLTDPRAIAELELAFTIESTKLGENGGASRAHGFAIAVSGRRSALGTRRSLG
jgi:hypothetical protein